MADQVGSSGTSEETMSVDEQEPLAPISRTENILKYSMLAERTCENHASHTLYSQDLFPFETGVFSYYALKTILFFIRETFASIFLYVTLDKFENPNLITIVKVQYGIITSLCIIEIICAFVGLYGFYYDKMKYMYLFLGIVGLVFICQLVELTAAVLLFIKEKKLINKMMDYNLQSYDGSEENMLTNIQYKHGDKIRENLHMLHPESSFDFDQILKNSKWVLLIKSD
ncbi:hypothetical protein HELRODRAFT_163635 [Helobdella robusta]|uniref:Uncharacterized protein n=1 Tax=Helobdella robusta TaxID=6412 RepID=T1EUA7_HELRO|nr:hypothetical protein HELRODRAFT_163635 [Helobdella robusta]ESN96558.1 hypothetical protein HELRODRAFT_163635 [Helobdella robusta]